MMQLEFERRAELRDQEFAQFWAAYPRHIGKGRARTAFSKALRKTTLDVMLKAIAWQVHQPSWRDGFIPHPTTWLNGEEWLDEPFEAPRRRNGNGGSSSSATAQIQKTQEMKRLIQTEGLSIAEAARRVGFD